MGQLKLYGRVLVLFALVTLFLLLIKTTYNDLTEKDFENLG